MIGIFEFIHLIEISRLVQICDTQKFSRLWKSMYEAFTFHLSFDCGMLRKKNAPIFTEAHGICVPDKGSDMRISNFLKNFMSTLKSSFNTFWNFSEHITHWKDFQILIYKTLKFFSLEKVHFLRFFQNTRIWFATKSASVDQVLTKIFQIDPKLTFNVFHILNHDHISKIEKYIWWYRPPAKKRPFFWGGVEA